jgi:hypothetical protein
MRRPVPVNSFLLSPWFFVLFPFSQAASVATLPSALEPKSDERSGIDKPGREEFVS